MKYAALVAMLVLLLPRRADARELVYQAPTECPSRKDAEQRILARAPEGRRAAIDVRRNGPGYRGEVVLGSGEDRVVRSVDAASCAAVVEALVLVIALDARRDADEGREVPEAPPSLPPTPAPRTEPPRSADAAPARPAKEVSGTEVGFGAAAGISSFGAGPAPAGAILLGLAAQRPWLGSAWLHPSAHVTVSRTLTSTVERGPYEVRLAITSLSVDGCALGLRSAGARLFVPVCARFEVGALEAAAVLEAWRPWVAAGAAIRPRFDFGDGTTRPFVELGASSVAVLIRDSFTLPGERPVRPTFAWSATLGVGVSLQ